MEKNLARDADSMSLKSQQNKEQLIYDFYKNQLLSSFENEQDFEIMFKTLKEDLSSCIRIINIQNSPHIVNEIIQNHASNLELQQQKDSKENFLSLALQKWYKEGTVYTFQISWNILWKNQETKELHQTINQLAQSGFIQRQELVSMLPVIFLKIQPSDSVLDMCAAPGSKTSQIIEALQQTPDKCNSGFVIANELDYKRSNILAHQAQKLKSPCFMITNHPGQFIPTLYDTCGYPILFDKVLVDAPCSGDGAIRKIPERWINWSPYDGLSLHSVQIQVLKRGLNLLKEGGTLVYSTCSMNAIENEAVVSAVMNEFLKNNPESLELIDIHKELTDFKVRKGLNNWNVQVLDHLNQNLLSYDNYQQFKQEYFESNQKLFNKVPPTAFPQEKNYLNEIIRIQNTARVYPHDNNTGGFYVAVFKKLKNFRQETQQLKQMSKQQISPQFLTQEEINSIQKSFNLNQDFPFDQLIKQQNSTKRVNLISSQLKQFLLNSSISKINHIYEGLTVFVKNKTKIDDYPDWRMSQDGVNIIKPFLQSNILQISFEYFNFLISQKGSIEYQSIPAQFQQETQMLKDQKLGSYCLEINHKINELLVQENIIVCLMPFSLVVMIGVEELNGF